MAGEADAVVEVDTTLSVWPAADIPLTAARRGVPFIIINRGETGADLAADLTLNLGPGEAMTELVDRIL
jgi:NAD-dependent SIR2 family protein deacetylase